MADPPTVADPSGDQDGCAEDGYRAMSGMRTKECRVMDGAEGESDLGGKQNICAS